ncbi:MAG: PIN domain-containing protein [Betaproteobacteria bacterium]|nr:PIN domain-containing protein [Betaproteobacteria bacterium]
MIAPVFVDSNVLVYARDPRDAAKQSRAAYWVSHLWKERLGRASAQVLYEYYVTVTRKLRPRVTSEDAWDDVKSFLAWRPQAIDEALLQRAREIEQRYRLSWWDSMVVAAAQLQDCALLLSEDLQDGTAFGGVTVRSPFTLAVEELRARYEVASTAQPHPPRGRPRRKGR